MNSTTMTRRMIAADAIQQEAALAVAKLCDEGASITALTPLVTLGDEIERAKKAMVEQLRYQGWTWMRIGEALGVSKQAAQQRYGL